MWPVGSKFRWIPTVFHLAAMFLIISRECPEGVVRRVSCSREGFVSVGDCVCAGNVWEDKDNNTQSCVVSCVIRV